MVIDEERENELSYVSFFIFQLWNAGQTGLKGWSHSKVLVCGDFKFQRACQYSSLSQWVLSSIEYF